MTRIFFILLLLPLLFVCTEYPDNNPFDEDYDGDYSLTVDWGNLPGTLGTFINYTIPYLTGADSLHSYVIHDTLNNIVASISYTDSTLHLYFVREDSGDISIKGYALNEKEIISNDTHFIIINPFLVFPVDSVIFGKQFSCSLTVKPLFDGLFAKDSTDSVIWSYSVHDTYDTITKSVVDTIAFPVTSLDSLRIRFRFKDKQGNQSSEVYRSFNVKKYSPSVNAPDDTLMTRVGNVLVSIKFNDENDIVDSAFFMLRDTIVTRKKLEFPDTATVSVSTGFEPITEMLYVWVKDQSGLISEVDSTFLITVIPDHENPFIRVYNQNEDTIKTIFDSVDVLFLAWDNWINGVTAVTCTTEDNSIISGTYQDTINDSTIWKVTITDLPFRETYSVKACAIDSFNNVSPCTTFYMYFDSTFSDITPPKITLITPNTDSMRVYVDTFTARFTVTDLVGTVDTIDDGIDIVYYEINDTFAGVATKVDSITYRFFDTLPQFNLNTITIVARDSSACHNTATYPIKFFYNTIPTGISNISPQDSADSVFCLDSLRFSWNHAYDADGDNISYDLFYGTDPGSFTNPITSDSFYTAKDIKGGLTYLWYINVITKLDQIRCPAGSGYYRFTTKDNPAIISGFNDTSVTINDTVPFQITATDYEGIKEYRWDFNGDGANDGTTAEPDTIHLYSDTGVYNAKVTVVDSVNNTTIDTAVITITDNLPIVDANPGSDTIYVNYTNDTIRLNPTASDDGRVVKYEWSFNGGSTYLDYTSTSGITSFPADLSGLPKTLKYYFRVTDEDGNPSTDSVYVYINMKWELSTSAPWIVDRLYFAVATDDSAMYVLGGWVGGTIKRDVWQSTDGEVWQNIAEANSFTQRYRHAATIKNDTIYVAGGDVTHDIWRSADGGITWDSIGDLKDIDILYQNKLAGAEMVTFKDTFYLLGGNYGASESNKVFSSMNGVNWNSLNTYYQVADRRFKATDNFSVFSADDSLWVLAEDEMWHSDPIPFGDSWTRDAIVSEFTGYSGLIMYNDTMYVVSGNTFWFSIDRGQNWQRMTSSAPWSGSNYQRVVVFNNKMWVFTDKGIWYSTDTP